MLFRSARFLIFYYFSSDPEDAAQYVFIDNFCSTESDTTLLEVYKNGIGQVFEFGLASFTFNEDADVEIYLHCQVGCQTITRVDFDSYFLGPSLRPIR